MARRPSTAAYNRELRRAAQLILDGRHGRAVRTMARLTGESTFLFSAEERIKWATELLATPANV